MFTWLLMFAGCTRIYNPYFLCFFMFFLLGSKAAQAAVRYLFAPVALCHFSVPNELQSVATVGSRGIPMGEMSFPKILLSLGIILVCSPSQGPEPLKNAVSIYSMVIYRNL